MLVKSLRNPEFGFAEENSEKLKVTYFGEKLFNKPFKELYFGEKHLVNRKIYSLVKKTTLFIISF